MAQRMTSKFGAGETSGLVVRALPEAAAAAAYGGTDRLVLLAKPLRAGAGHYVYMPVAVVRLQELPQELRRQVAAAGTSADAPEPLPGPLQLDAVVPVGLLGQLAGGPNVDRTIEFAGEGASGGAHEYSQSQRRVLRLMTDQGGKAVYLDASGLQELIDVTEGTATTNTGAFYDTGLTAPENADDGNMPARGNGVPVVVALLLQLSDPGAFDDPKSPSEDAAPLSTETLLGDGRAAEQGARRYYDVLLPPPENLMPAVDGKASRGSLSHSYPVQVSVDAAAGAKAGDPIAVVGVKGAAAGVEAGRGHGGLSALVGVAAASSAATALAAGAAGPVMAFGLFAVLIGGLSLAMGVVAGV